MKPLLESFRGSGRKLFLATNSLWDYTHVVMNYLISQKIGPQRDEEWLEYFDAVVVGEFPTTTTTTIMVIIYLYCHAFL